MDHNVPVSAVCNEAVKLAGKRHFVNLKGFANGRVLKLYKKDKKVYLYSNKRGKYSNAFIKSTMNIKYITESQEPLDMSSYKEIMLNQ